MEQVRRFNQRETLVYHEEELRNRIERAAISALGALLVGRTINPEQAAEQAEEYALALVKRLDASSKQRLEDAKKELK